MAREGAFPMGSFGGAKGYDQGHAAIQEYKPSSQTFSETEIDPYDAAYEARMRRERLPEAQYFDSTKRKPSSMAFEPPHERVEF
jgi:hypothetical protein